MLTRFVALLIGPCQRNRSRKNYSVHATLLIWCRWWCDVLSVSVFVSMCCLIATMAIETIKLLAMTTIHIATESRSTIVGRNSLNHQNAQIAHERPHMQGKRAPYFMQNCTQCANIRMYYKYNYIYLYLPCAMCWRIHNMTSISKCNCILYRFM